RRGERSPDLAARARQSNLFDRRRPAADARLLRQGGIHHRLSKNENRVATRSNESATMSSNPTRSHLPALPIGFLLLAGLAAAPLAGCGLDSARDDPVGPSDYHQRHPIVLAQAPTTLDVYPVGGGLDSQSAADIRAFAQRYRALGTGRITILAPAGAPEANAKVVNA